MKKRTININIPLISNKIERNLIMNDNYIVLLKIGLIKELSKQGVLTKEEEEAIIKKLKTKINEVE